MTTTMEKIILHPGMGLALAAVEVVAELCPIPGPQTIIQALQAVKDAVEKAKWRREECQRLAVRCQMLVDAFEEDKIRIAKTGLEGPVQHVTMALEYTQGKITEFSTWSRMKAYWHDDDIQKALEQADVDIELAINKLKMTYSGEGVNVMKNIKNSCLQRETVDLERIDQTVSIMEALHNPDRPMKNMSTEDLQKAAASGIKVLHNMQGGIYADEDQLQIEGVRVDRAQFNAVWTAIEASLRAVQEETGLKLEVRNLGAEVWKSPQSQPWNGGDMTELYEGFLHGKERVMIKCLRGIRNASEATKVRILNQVKVWSHFQHPRVHTFIGITDNYYYLSMVSAFYEHGNIMMYTRGDQKKNKYHLLAGAVEGLIYLHDKWKVCHGNLRGNNILINDEGEALVADFEMSKLLTGLAKDLHLEAATLTRQPSPRWKAPEIMGTNLQPTFKSDVWSVGMVMLEVLTGFQPFHLYRRNEQVMFQVSQYGLRPKRPENNPQLPDDAWEIMQACWATNPEDRPELRDVHARLLKLEAWWDETKPNPPEEPKSRRDRWTAFLD